MRKAIRTAYAILDIAAGRASADALPLLALLLEIADRRLETMLVNKRRNACDSAEGVTFVGRFQRSVAVVVCSDGFARFWVSPLQPTHFFPGGDGCAVTVTTVTASYPPLQLPSLTVRVEAPQRLFPSERSRRSPILLLAPECSPRLRARTGISSPEAFATRCPARKSLPVSCRCRGPHPMSALRHYSKPASGDRG